MYSSPGPGRHEAEDEGMIHHREELLLVEHVRLLLGRKLVLQHFEGMSCSLGTRRARPEAELWNALASSSVAT